MIRLTLISSFFASMTVMAGCAGVSGADPDAQEVTLTSRVSDRTDGALEPVVVRLTAERPRVRVTMQCDEWFSCDAQLYARVVNLAELDPGDPELVTINYRGLAKVNAQWGTGRTYGYEDRNLYARRDASGLFQCAEWYTGRCDAHTASEPEALFEEALHSPDRRERFTFTIDRNAEELAPGEDLVLELSGDWY